MTKSFQSKLPNTKVTIFSRMTALAQAHQAINLSQGFPDFDLDPRLTSLVTKYLGKGFNQYAPMPGTMELRRVIAEKYRSIYNLNIDAQEEITITAGGTQALYNVIGCLIHPGDEVILFEPAYDSYGPSVQSFGGTVVPIVLEAPDFRIDWDLVKNKISSKTKLIIINNPNNPTGRLLDAQDIKALEKLVSEHDIFVLSDEVYEHLVFDRKKHISILSSSLLRERGFVVASFGKVLHATGWKLGYVVASPFLTAEMRKIHQFNVFSVNTPMQYAIAEYLEDPTYYEKLALLFQQKRDYVINSLRNSKFSTLPCEGTYFILADYSELSNQDELDFAIALTEKHKTATIPVSAFYSETKNQHLIRLCFAKKEETLEAALRNLSRL